MDWYAQRDRREQVILALGALLAAVVIGWRFVWVPLDARAADLGAQVEELSRLAVDVQRAAGLSDLGSTPGATVGSGSLLSILDQVARPLGLASRFERQRQDGPDAIYVSFRDAPFDALNTWLTILDAEYGLSVALVSSISASATPGLVDGQILLARS